MTYIGRDIANHSLYPDHYVPRKPSRTTVLREVGKDLAAFFGSKLWFWAVAISAFTWLAYIFAKWALTQAWAMRIGI